jgi:hypothetical protein
MSLSSDGCVLAIGCTHGSIRLWDTDVVLIGVSAGVLEHDLMRTNRREPSFRHRKQVCVQRCRTVLGLCVCVYVFVFVYT